MIKAKKGLLITLFAALMIFAFGATSAFAATTVKEAKWDETNFASVTVTDSEDVVTTYTNVVRTWHQGTGAINCELDWSSYSPSTTPDWAGTPQDPTATYYDLNGATMVISGSDLVDNYSYAEYTALDKKTITVKTIRPEYTTDLHHAGDKSSAATLTDWTLTSSIKALDESTADQQGTITAKWTASSENAAKFVGSLADKTVTVKGTAATQALFLDDDKTTDVSGLTYNAAYDGKAHAVVAADVAGWTVKYQKFNSSTANWDDVSAINFKEVADNGQFKAVYSKTGKTDVPKLYTVDMVKASAISFAWDTHHEATETADPYDFIEVTGTVNDEDKALALQFFKDTCDITVDVDKVDNQKVKWTIAKKEGVDAEKVYNASALSGNYNAPANFDTALAVGAVSARTLSPDTNSNFAEDDITFITAPNMKYKAKKLKKKDASFTVEAIADSGNTITYLMTSPDKKITIDSATGTITVAKKIKKGTYPVKIKAKTKAGNGYKACKEVVELTIKVK